MSAPSPFEARRSGPVPLTLGLGEEQVPLGERTSIETMLAIHREVQEAVDRRRNPVPRGQHPKQHGCVYAEFVVEDDLPSDLRHGILAQPRTFPALIRFSNARLRNDALPDAHGMAIKLFEVEGPRLLDDGPGAATLDFVLVDHPVFFMANVADGVSLLRDFQELVSGGLVGRSRVVLRGMFSQKRAFQILRAMAAKRPASPLSTRFWSTTPLRLGEHAVKVSARPRTQSADVPRCGGRDRLRRALAGQLAGGAAVFDFAVQVQSHPVGMPVEDPTVEWDENSAPFQRVAEIRIPAQQVHVPELLAFGERLSFTPWHGIEQHRPLGGINRARRVLYEVLATRRRVLNGAPLREPTADEVRALWAPALR